MLNPASYHPKSFADHTQPSISLKSASIVVRNVILSRIQNTLIDGAKHTNVDQQYLLMTIRLLSNKFWTCVMRFRVEGAVSDLHAVEARYHVDCSSRFVTNRLSKGVSKKAVTEKVEDPGLLQVVCLAGRK